MAMAHRRGMRRAGIVVGAVVGALILAAAIWDAMFSRAIFQNDLAEIGKGVLAAVFAFVLIFLAFEGFAWIIEGFRSKNGNSE